MMQTALNEAGIKSIGDFITMSPHNIEDLTYTQSVNNKDDTELDFTSRIPLQLVYKTHITILHGYITYRIDIEDPITNSWTKITTQQIDNYVCSNHWQIYRSTKFPKALTAEMSPSEIKVIPVTLNYGQPNETNVCIVLPNDPLIPDPYHTNLVTKTEYFSSPCGELSQSVNLMSTSNNILPQSETSATTSSNACTLRVAKPDILQPTMQPTLPTTCKIIPVTHLPLPLSKEFNGVLTTCMKACCPDDIQSLPRSFGEWQCIGK